MPQGGVSRETANLPSATIERLRIFIALLVRWNATVNLISRADEPYVWDRHVADCLQLSPYMADVSRAIDLGSGAGLPGLVLAIATEVPFTLVEADHRKAAFLREAARATDAPAAVVATRIEAAQLEPAALITARALAPLPRLLGWATLHLTPAGFCLFLKGSSAEKELTAAQREWQMRVTRFPSRTAPGATILRISEISRVGVRP